MNETVIIAVGLAVLSIASGMLGLGVAFAAVPFLGFFMTDLVHEVQPLSLFLNGITALFSLFGFARSGLVMWKPAILLAVVTTLTAPFGAWLAQHIQTHLCPDREVLGDAHWAKSARLWYPFFAAHQGHADLPAHEESARHPTVARTHQT